MTPQSPSMEHPGLHALAVTHHADDGGSGKPNPLSPQKRTPSDSNSLSDH